MADVVTAALPAQTTPQGYYNIERMLKAVVSKGAQIRICGTCAEGRGIHKLVLIQGTESRHHDQLAQWVVEADKVLNHVVPIRLAPPVQTGRGPCRPMPLLIPLARARLESTG